MEPRFGRVFSQSPVRAAIPTLQARLIVNEPGDQYEREADQIAEQVLGAAIPAPAGQAQGTAGYDFSEVRVHTDTKAAESARAVNAMAYTVGRDVVLAIEQYAPGTTAGQRLLAHELTHYIQQQTTTPQLQRKLSVNPLHPALAPATDPAAALTQAQRFSMMDSLIQSLCDRFEVDGATGEVRSKSLQSLDPAVLVAESKPTGCCCLNVLTAAPTNWTIQVSQVVGAQTRFGSNEVVLNPTNAPVEFGSFTAASSLAFQGAVPTAGHELCGHAALQELSAHPIDVTGQDRLTTDIHDPTVRIENLVSSEQGVPAAELRGLAASGPHRGESVDRITIQNFSFNSNAVPASETSKVQFAAAYITENDSFVSILGHSDNVGSSAAKQFVSTQRANTVKAALIANGVPPTITKFGFVGIDRFSRVEGVSDSQPPPPPLDANAANWRRVEILTAGFPAGALQPPPGTPTAVNPHLQSPNVSTLKASSDACVRHLVGGAYP
jgi:outer membrane protein OmpA-like peptidoglycan-associated protein